MITRVTNEHELCVTRVTSRPMSLLRTLPRFRLANACWQSRRLYATNETPSKKPEPEDDLSECMHAFPTMRALTVSQTSQDPAKSCCPDGTVLVGLNWLKDQEAVTAKPDDAYPEWLWKILEPKPIPKDGPGGKGERVLMRKQNRARIREQNFMNTQ